MEIKMNNEYNNILNNLKMDYEGSKTLHDLEQGIIDYSVAEYDGDYKQSNNNSGFGSQGPGSRKLGSADEVFTFNDTKKAIESALPSLTEPFLAESDIMLIEPKDAQSVTTAKVLNILMNKQYAKMDNNLELIETIAKKVQLEGTTFLKVGWKDNSPIMESIPSSSVYLDPTAKRMADLNFLCETSRVSIGDILANPSWYGQHSFESLSELVPAVSQDNYEEAGYDNATGFNFEDRSRQQVDIVTYYGMYDLQGNGIVQPIYAIWSDEKLLILDESPFPDEFRGIPFEAGIYIRRTGSIYGDSTASLTEDTSIVRTMIMRNVLKVVSRGGQGQKGVAKGSMDPVNFKRFTQGLDYQYNRPDFQVEEGTYNDVPVHITNLMEQLKTEQEELLGTGRLNSGLDPRALNSGTSATAAQLVNNNSEKRLLQTTRHIAELLERVFRKWLLLNQQMLDNSVVNLNGQYVPVSGKQLDGNYDLEITAGVVGKKSERIQNLNLMMGKMVESGREIPSSMLGQMANMLDMPRLAAEFTMEEAQREQGPTPEEEQQQQMQQQLQLNGAMLEQGKVQSEIKKNNSTAALNQAKSMSEFVDASNASYGLN